MLDDIATMETASEPETAAEQHSGPASVIPVAARAGKGKARLLSIDDLDRRTRAARDCQATRNAILADLGGADQLSTLERCLADHVAVLDVVAADLGYRWLAGEQIDPGALCAVVNTLRRAGGSLGWRRRAKAVSNDLTKRLREIDGGTNGD